MKTKLLTLSKSITGALSIGILATQMAWAAPATTEATAMPQAEFNQMVKEALVNNPEILKAAIIALQENEQNKVKEQQGKSLNDNYAALFNNKMDPWMGAENPELTIAYFTDFNCPYCKKIEPLLDRLVEENPEIRVVYKLVPILGPSSKEATDLALTVWQNEPEKFAELHKKLMSRPSRLDSEAIAKVGKLTDTEEWLDDTGKSVETTINTSMGLMREFGLSGTPALVFADQIVGGLVPYEQLEKQVKAALAAKRNK
ncbi:DsbA family protein [Moritella sp. F3]|uniref:DsbA family protein n=1 Tax=Moritella sp. F3 TaxID=2718882 RepID=UPI0018E12D4D|nr:DsbA family protein [Moritella sp. F3]GIC75729.1 copper-sensitivity protein C [Moritella sp. F1]GIC81823.1 copper-sensitivity protein C [Moritella sp. F3]